MVLVAAAEMQMDASGAPRFPAGVWVRTQMEILNVSVVVRKLPGIYVRKESNQCFICLRTSMSSSAGCQYAGVILVKYCQQGCSSRSLRPALLRLNFLLS